LISVSVSIAIKALNPHTAASAREPTAQSQGFPLTLLTSAFDVKSSAMLSLPVPSTNLSIKLGNLSNVNSFEVSRLRIAAIGFLNPAPLMWDFEHPPLNLSLARRYSIEYMLPSECAARLSSGAADIGLIPIAALSTIPGLRILPGCTIASKHRVRSLLLVRRSNMPLSRVRSVAADTASRTTVAYTRILFHKWGNPSVEFIPMAANLDTMLERADAAIIIGDPALLALEEESNRYIRTGEELVYHDLAYEWRSLTDLPFVSAVWAAAPDCKIDDNVADDFIRSRDQGLNNIETLVTEWSHRFPMQESTIRTYLTENIHYVLDEECIDGMRGFFRMAAETGVLPAYDFSMEPSTAR
jgi:chorismate dehydratase